MEQYIENTLQNNILEACPIVYFHCKITKENKFIILNTNYKCISKESDSYFNDIAIIHDFSWTKLANIVFEKNCFSNEFIEIKKHSSDELIIWYKRSIIPKETNIKNELESQQKLLEIFIDSVTDIIFYKDTQGRYILVNNKWAESVKINRNKLNGKTDFDIDILKNKAVNFKKADDEIIKTKKISKFITQFKAHNGDISYYETLKTPFLDADGTVIGIIGIVRDITEQKQALEEAKLNEQKFKHIFDNIQDIVAILSNNKVTYINDAVEKIFGITDKMIYESNSISVLRDRIHPNDLYKFDESQNENFMSNNFSIDIRIIRTDNELKWIKYKTSPMKGYSIDNPHNIVIISDITSEKYQELELDKMRMDFFANISHEFKTPINLIFSSMQVLKMNLNKTNSNDLGDCFKYIDITNQNIFRLLKLTNNLIDSNKFNSGYYNYNPKNYDIVNFIENVCTSVIPFAEEKGITLIFDTNIEEKVINFDLNNVERILLNLISNSIKFNNINGKVIVSIISHKEFLEIKIKDNGIGIEKDKIDVIFDRFKRVTNRMTKICEGSGLGLFIVKSLIDIEKGNITVNSTLGIGTEFIIRLNTQLLDLVPQSPEHEHEQIKNQKNERIIIELSDL